MHTIWISKIVLHMICFCSLLLSKKINNKNKSSYKYKKQMDTM